MSADYSTESFKAYSHRKNSAYNNPAYLWIAWRDGGPGFALSYEEFQELTEIFTEWRKDTDVPSP